LSILNYILKNENSIYYECGYSCDNVIFINLGNESFFITDARYKIDAQLNVKSSKVIISNNLIKSLIKIIKKLEIKKILFDPFDFDVSSFNKLQNNIKTQLIPKDNFSKLKRIIKTDDEIELLKKASQLGRHGFELFSSFIKKNGFNCSEKKLQFKAKEFISQIGKYDLSFDPIVAFNKNSAKPHAFASDLKLKNSDLILVDAGIKYERYCSDRTCVTTLNNNISFTRTQQFSKKKQQKIYDIVLSAQQKAIEKVKVGMKASKIDKIARDVIEKSGYGKYFVHNTGHGVGLDIHEYPNISSHSDVIIEDNMVFTIEPGIYLLNKFGVRIEDTVAIQNGKAIIL
jgi:Xaa-Pro aminopeptidase